jgi:hypothetical protein
MLGGKKAILGGSSVTMAWHILRLQKEETASNYGVLPQIQLIRSHGEPLRDHPPGCGLEWSCKPLTIKKPLNRT